MDMGMNVVLLLRYEEILAIIYTHISHPTLTNFRALSRCRIFEKSGFQLTVSIMHSFILFCVYFRLL